MGDTIDKRTEAPRCQSCGMPMTKDSDHGTDEDGTKNMEYCAFCYRNGDFTDEGITLEQKMEKNAQIAVKMGLPEEKAREMARNVIPTLKRWKK